MVAFLVDSLQSYEYCRTRLHVGVALKGCRLATQSNGWTAVTCSDAGFSAIGDEWGPVSCLCSRRCNLLQFDRLSTIPDGRVR